MKPRPSESHGQPVEEPLASYIQLQQPRNMVSQELLIWNQKYDTQQIEPKFCAEKCPEPGKIWEMGILRGSALQNGSWRVALLGIL